ncbi:hypothetical protein WAZ07_21675 [Bacillus sp. FJAT-51639]|uniref:Uncharacterized protein n=1 Tax=Bacillus bruguierae TaxID=3127667 RepID=A0ABU8FM75_9BACI
MMSEELKKLIKNYGIDVEDELDVSPFEFAYTFRTRELLATQYELLVSLITTIKKCTFTTINIYQK